MCSLLCENGTRARVQWSVLVTEASILARGGESPGRQAGSVGARKERVTIKATERESRVGDVSQRRRGSKTTELAG